MWAQAVFILGTLGLYLVWWFYITATEMVQERRLQENPTLWTVLLFIPLGSIYAFWKYSRLVEQVTGGKYHKVLMYIAWLLFPPAVWFLVQVELNKLARKDG